MTSTKVVITGGSGFIGQHIAMKFLAAGREVSIADIREPTKETLRPHFARVDVFDPKAVRNHLAGADSLIHLVGLADAGTAKKDPDLSYRLNVQSLHNVLEAARIEGVKRVVFPSSAAVYGSTEELPIRESAPLRPTNIYSWHKAMCESYLRGYAANYGVNYVALRLFNVYGADNKGVIDAFLTKARKGELIESFGPMQYRDFVYAGDVAEAMFRAVVYDKASNRVLNIGSGHGTQIREVLELVREILPQAKWVEKKAEFTMYDSIADITLARILLDLRPRAGREAMKDIILKEMA